MIQLLSLPFLYYFIWVIKLGFLNTPIIYYSFMLSASFTLALFSNYKWISNQITRLITHLPSESDKLLLSLKEENEGLRTALRGFTDRTGGSGSKEKLNLNK